MKRRGKLAYTRDPKLVERDAHFVLRFMAGETLAQIGEAFGVTRERVRQRLAALGLSAMDGGRAMQTALNVRTKAKKKSLSRDDRFLARYGMDCAAMAKVSTLPLSDPKHPIRKYGEQKHNARARGIGWGLTFKQWWDIWQQSGHWVERGPGKGYCMARWGDSGPYSVENVYICTIGQNFADSYIVHPADQRKQKFLARKAAESQHASAPEDGTSQVSAV